MGFCVSGCVQVSVKASGCLLGILGYFIGYLIRE